MTSEERVLAAFEHAEPDHVPAWCGSSVESWAKAKRELGLDDEALRERFHDDFRKVPRLACPAVATVGEPTVALCPSASSAAAWATASR